MARIIKVVIIAWFRLWKNGGNDGHSTEQRKRLQFKKGDEIPESIKRQLAEFEGNGIAPGKSSMRIGRSFNKRLKSGSDGGKRWFWLEDQTFVVTWPSIPFALPISVLGLLLCLIIRLNLFSKPVNHFNWWLPG